MSSETVNQKIAQAPETTVRVEEDVERLAEFMGVTRDKIRVLRPNYADLMRNGVIAQVHVHRFRGKTPLSYQDIGINLTDKESAALSKTFKLGHKLLLPSDVVNQGDALDNKARRELRKIAIQTHWGFFIPYTAYEEFKGVMDEIEQEYYALRDEISGSDAAYSKMIDDLVKEYRLTAASTYGRLRDLAPRLLETDDNVYETITVDGEPIRITPVEDFVDNYINSILAHIPSRQAIYSSFHFELDFSYIPLPDLLAEQEAAAQLIQERAATERTQEQAERERIAEQARMEEFERQIEREKKVAELRAAESAAQAKERMMRQMHQDVVSRAQRNAERLITGYLQDVQERLSNIMYEACVGVLEYTTEKGKMHPRKRVQLDKMIEQAKRIAAFTGDEDVNGMIARIENELAIPADKRDLADLEEVLRDTATVTRDWLIFMDSEPRSFTEAGVSITSLGIPSEINVQTLAESRSRLGLAVGDFEISVEVEGEGRIGRFAPEEEMAAEVEP